MAASALAKQRRLRPDRGWEPLGGAGFRPVAAVAVDGVWSALRFRAKERVGS